VELFELSTEGGDPLIKTGQINFSQEVCGIGMSYIGPLWYNYIFALQVKLSPDRRILLSADQSDNGRVGVFYSSSGDANKMDFSFVDHKRLPNPKNTNRREEMPAWAPSFVFSADGSKFATATPDGVVTIWDAQNGLHLKVYVVEVPSHVTLWPISFLQFSSGISGREVLVFMEVVDPSTLISANK
jgi:WD40 repeat protein